MIRIGGVSVWRSEWGDPTRLTFTAALTAAFAAAFARIVAIGRIGWPGDAFFVDRLSDPVKFNIILAVIGILGLVSLAAFASTAWDLVAAWRRDSDRS
ncbi:hypothetical protein MMB232_00781 [Brevundimonas subvibrioides]|uniref:hypothetical protein n=1 Tax=Brevundimonas subvibrioides TaxID=74313 RepID=UPI0032D5A655